MQRSHITVAAKYEYQRISTILEYWNETISMIMDNIFILEKAKELLIRDRKLLPVLFVETARRIFIVGLVGDINKKSMINVGRKFAKDSRQKIYCLCLVSGANVSKIGLDDDKLIEKGEAIIVIRWDLNTDKREMISQEYQINDDVTFIGDPQEFDNPVVHLLEAFVEGTMKEGVMT